MRGTVQDADLKLLRLFRTVARLGGFTAAQHELGTTQSSISTSMAQLEQRLGMRLCDRGVRGFSLTEEGDAVLKATERLVAALDDFRQEVSEVSHHLSGELRLGMVDNIATSPDFIVPQAVDALLAKSLDVSFSIFVGPSQELEARLLDGRLHCAVGLNHREIDDLVYHPLFAEGHNLYCGAGHDFFTLPDREISDDVLQTALYVGRDYLETMPLAEAADRVLAGSYVAQYGGPRDAHSIRPVHRLSADALRRDLGRMWSNACDP